MSDQVRIEFEFNSGASVIVCVNTKGGMPGREGGLDFIEQLGRVDSFVAIDTETGKPFYVRTANVDFARVL